MASKKYVKKLIPVEAVQWTGGNLGVLISFAGNNFIALDDDEREHSDDPAATAEVLDSLHSTGILVYTGDYIIKGVRGEFYPCRQDVFEETYEEYAD